MKIQKQLNPLDSKFYNLSDSIHFYGNIWYYYIWYFSRVIESSEHDGAFYRTLAATQFDCVGVNKPF